MELITILNRCHRFRGFVYHQARFSSDGKTIEVAGYPVGAADAGWSGVICHNAVFGMTRA